MAIGGRTARPGALEGFDTGTLDRPVTQVRSERTPPIKFFAFGGAVLLAFIAYVWVSWATGPNFEQVPVGPSDLPGWMKTVQTAWQPAGLLAVVFCYWWFLIKPWRAEGRITTDGLLVIAFSTLWFEDPLSAYFGHWFTYNANLVNFGSWVHEVPGWMSYGEPGAMLVEPILLIGPVYVYFIMIGVLLGCWVMRSAKARWPALRAWQLLVICFFAMCALDIVAEGLIWLPLGFWEYPGGYGLLFPSSYHKLPWHEVVAIGATFTSISALRYFRDDRGYTFAERGAEQLRGGRQTLLRILAVTFAAHALLFTFYNVPGLWIGANSADWPKDLQKRSYFLDGLCGVGTDRHCPGPGVPNVNGNDSPYMNLEGKMVIPAGNPPPSAPVPLDRGKPGGAD
jgi:hypothetical protein